MLSPIIIDGKTARQIPYSRVLKKPIIKNWTNDASSDPQQLAIWSTLYPWAVPGVLCDQWTVLDADDIGWLHEHEHLLPRTFQYRTARGRHFYFERVPHLKSSIGKIAPKIDVKTGRAAVIYWPHINGLRPVEAPLASFPNWLLEKLRDEPRHEVPGASALIDSSQSRGPNTAKGNGTPMVRTELPKPLYFKVLDLVPRSTKVTAHHQRRVIGLLRTLVQVHELRNNALNSISFAFRELIAAEIISVEAATALLFDAATINGYVAKDSAAAAMATIRSGLGCALGSHSLNPECTDDTVR
jgi:hypothetical protein